MLFLILLFCALVRADTTLLLTKKRCARGCFVFNKNATGPFFNAGGQFLADDYAGLRAPAAPVAPRAFYAGPCVNGSAPVAGASCTLKTERLCACPVPEAYLVFYTPVAGPVGHMAADVCSAAEYYDMRGCAHPRPLRCDEKLRNATYIVPAIEREFSSAAEFVAEGLPQLFAPGCAPGGRAGADCAGFTRTAGTFVIPSGARARCTMRRAYVPCLCAMV